MYKKEYKSTHFLRKESDVLDRIDFANYDDPDALVEYFDRIKQFDTNGLVLELSELETQLELKTKQKDEKELLGNQKNVLRELLSVRLGLGFEFHFLIDMLQNEFNLIEDAFEQLARYKLHRHKTMFGLYTEKPNY